MLGLKVGAGDLERVDERGLLLALLLGKARQHLRAGDEHVRQILVAVNVEEHVAADRVDRIAHGQHFGAALGIGRHPLAVQVRAGRIGAQVAVHAAVRIHVRDDVERHAIVELARHRIAGPVAPSGQPLDQAFDEPLGHRLARMLARDDPYLLLRRIVGFRRAERQQRHRTAFDRAAELDDARLRQLLDRAEKRRVTLFRVRFEIRVVDAVELGCMVDGHRLAVERRRHAEPVDPVVARHRVIVAPARRVCAFGCVLERHHAPLAARARQAVVKPLRELRTIVAAHAQPDRVGALARHDVDGACVEITGDRKGHLSLSVVDRR